MTAQAYIHYLNVINTGDAGTIEPVNGYYIAKAGDANSLLNIFDALLLNNNNGRVKVFLPDGTYDLGKKALTAIPYSNVSIIGQSMDNVVLKSLTAEPFETTYRPTAKGTYNITAIATDAEGKQSKIAKYVLKVNNKRTAHKGVVNLPGIIEAENFDRGGEGFTYHDSDSKDEGGTNYRSDSEGVDIVTGNNSHALGYTAVNEWVEYSVNVTEGGKYAYKATVSSGVTGSGFTIGLVEDGKITSLCKVNVPQTGSNNWDTYKTVTGYLSKNLEAGNQILRFTINGANCNIDKVEFICTVSDGLEVVTTAEPADNTTP